MSDCIKKAKEARNKICRGIGKSLIVVLKVVADAAKASTEPQINLPTEITLGLEELKQLKGMYPSQLEKIFKNKKVKLADGPEVYRMLSGFYPGQLEAIFGKEE